jgi:biopolymer transport protein ExbD
MAQQDAWVTVLAATIIGANVMTEHYRSEYSPDEEETVHHKSPRQKRDIESASMQLNLTSMIDIIFQLLIYFVVTSSFAANEGVLASELPYGGQSSSPMEMPPMNLSVSLATPGGDPTAVNLAVNGRAVASFTALEDKLIALQDNPERGRNGPFASDDPVKIKPRRQVRWQHVVDAFNAAMSARYTDVAITAPQGQ